MSNKLSPRKLLVAFTASASVLLGGCATMKSEQQTNTHLFTGGLTEVSSRVDAITVGMTKQDVLAALKVNPNDMQRLDPAQVSEALYGKTQIIVPFDKREEAMKEQESLTGYRLAIRDVQTKTTLGTTHSKKNHNGYDVAYIFIFRDDVLIKKTEPIGGLIRGADRKGYLSELGSNIIDAIKP